MTELSRPRRALRARGDHRFSSAAVAAAILLSGCAGEEGLSPVGVGEPGPLSPTLVGFAMLPAATFAPGPTSGAALGGEPIHGQPLPFVDRQPVQGFSAVHRRKDGAFLVMSDNGFGAIENSADYHLRVHVIRPDFRAEDGGSGAIEVEGHIELSDPDHEVPFAITHHFTPDRILTGADFDIESMQVAPDGTLWFGDEFGPFLLHTDETGRLLDPPVPLPEFASKEGLEIRSPQSPFNEEASAVRIMNAVRAHAAASGGGRAPVFSPWEVMLADGADATFVENRKAPPQGSGLAPAASEIVDVKSLRDAGYPVVPYTVNDRARMTALLELGVDGIISDRPDLLRDAVRSFDADGDGTAGDYLDEDGLIDGARFDAQGHRGGRDLRPENTLPAFEAALDHGMTTLELDTGITADGVPVLSHDPLVMAQKCRRADGAPYEAAEEVLIKDLTAELLQSTFICDKLFRGDTQLNDPALSPVSQAFADAEGLPSLYAVPRLEQVFQLVDAYVAYYKEGDGASHPEASARWKTAARVRFNIETKVNPRAALADRTIGPADFADAVAGVIARLGLEERADIQSFDLRTLLHVHEAFPGIRTVVLLGDFPIYEDASIAGSDDGTNLQGEGGEGTPWLAGMPWPYRQTRDSAPFRARRSGGFEGMALHAGGTKLLTLLEQPLEGAQDRTLLIHEFDLNRKEYTGVHYEYPLDARGTNIGDFIMLDDTRGLVIERDGTEGDLTGFKAIFEISLGEPGAPVKKELLVDLMKIADPHGLSPRGAEGDVGLGAEFAFPFTTIEGVVLLGERRIGVLNDNNFPFGQGRHLGAALPDDSEFIVLDVGRPLVE
ncbi:esterase-like activity of phytase family protein [Sorangium sp. So ce1078]|uniref:esterase-like activity of phytase family protein n=1 Tax=Sorangium sp. So ce1078 TaxID=3133329 RepID=UPI003F6350CC